MSINDDMIAFNVRSDTPDIKFVVSLSDGRTVIQDKRSNATHAWFRLAEWLKANPEISMSNMRMHAPNGIDIKMPPNQKGYFFGQRQHAVWGGSQATYAGIGYYDGEIINVSWYRLPKFDHCFTEDRKVEDAGFFFIKNS